MKDKILFKRLMEDVKEFIYFKDTNSRFISMSKSLANRFGLNDPEEAKGKADVDFFGEEHAKEALQDEKLILETGKPILNKVEKEDDKDGDKEYWASTSKFPLYDDAGNIKGTYGISRDITKQKIAEEKLRRSDELFRKLSELAPGFLFLYEFGTDERIRFPFVSEGIRKIFGLAPEDIRDNFLLLLERTHPEDVEKVQESVRESVKNLIDWDCEYRIIHPTKGLRWVKGRAKPELQEDGKVLSPGFITDITNQKEIEEQLRHSDELFSKLSKLAPGFLYLHQVDEENSIQFPFASEGIREMFDLTPEDIKQSINPLMRRVHEDDLKRVMGSIIESVKYVSDWECEYRIIHPTKGLRWVKGKAKPELQKDGSVLSPGYLTDITEEKKIYEANEELKKQFQSVFNTDPNLIFVKDEVGKYIMANDAACKFFKKHRVDLLGKTDFDLGIPEERAKEYLEADKKVLKTGDPLFFPEIETKLESGEKRWHQTIKVPFQQVESDLKAVLSIVTDITDRKQKELELDETINIIGEQNQRLTNFAHIVSHNLRNHAGNISMLLNLYDPDESEEEKKEMLEFLKQASDNLNESIADLNEIVDQQQKTITQRKEINLKKYVAKTREILSTEILAHKVKFEIDVPDDLCLEYNPAYLESIILNMFSNAIKYRNPEITPFISVKAYEEEGHVFFEISDNGLGIDLKKHGKKLFGMYKTFHGNENSKGIGLFITKNQIESMGGRIDVESEPGKGTTFKIRLK